MKPRINAVTPHQGTQYKVRVRLESPPYNGHGDLYAFDSESDACAAAGLSDQSRARCQVGTWRADTDNGRGTGYADGALSGKWIVASQVEPSPTAWSEPWRVAELIP